MWNDRGPPFVASKVLLVLAATLLVTGCERATELAFTSPPELEQLDPPLREAVQQQLARLCGSAGRLKLLGGPDSVAEARHLEHGQQVYERNCAQCHGSGGDGAGPAAQYLSPRPRDYRKGVFKFNSTGYGNKPRREDLLRTVSQGVVGTSMPSFERLPKNDLEAVVDYVMALSRRGELETLLILQADGDGELSAETADELAQIVVDQWRAAGNETVEPATKEPPFDADSVAMGKEIFQKRECYKCHGRDGRGGLAGGIEVGKDAWGQTTAAADLTSGMLHGGHRPLDVYRRIYAGINGTPMPEFKNLLANEPESVWHLTHYILDLADQRRRGVQIPLGAASGGGAAEQPPAGRSGAEPDDASSPVEPSASEDAPIGAPAP
jgi:mono/diheme cytochrome c family protein